ncbi:MAG: hypothetical protein O2807_07965 [bacterium]|nr:hypothetical protein [bacterium]
MTEQLSAKLQFNLLGYRLRLLAPERLIHLLQSGLFTLWQEPPDVAPDVTVEIEQEGGQYRIVRGGDGRDFFQESDDSPSFSGSDDLDEIFWWLDYQICKAALEQSNLNFIQLHGAAAALNDKAILLLGDSYAGKSTLVAYLLRNGLWFLSDEVILLDPAALRIHRFPRNLLIREGTREKNADLARLSEPSWSYADGEGEHKWLVNPGRLEGQPGGDSAEVAQIVSLQKVERQNIATIHKIGPRQMIEELVNQSINLGSHQAKGLDALIRLANKGNNYRLEASHPGLGWEKLSAHLSFSARMEITGVEAAE